MKAIYLLLLIAFGFSNGADALSNEKLGFSRRWPSMTEAAIQTGPFATASSYLYLTDESFGLRVVDASNPSKMQFIGGLRGDWTPSAIRVAGRVIAILDATGAVRLIDSINPQAPQQVSIFRAKSPSVALALSPETLVAADVAGIVSIVDISSLSQPKLRSTYSNGAIGGVEVSGSNAFLLHGNGVEVVNFSDLDHPSRLTLYEMNNIERMTMSGTNLYLQFFSIYPGLGPVLQTIDCYGVGNASSPVFRGQYHPGPYEIMPSMAASGSRMVVSTLLVPGYLPFHRVIEFADSADCRSVGYYDGRGDLKLSSNGATLFALASNELRSTATNGASNPRFDQIGSLVANRAAVGLGVSGKLGCVLESGNFVQIIDLSRPDCPTLVRINIGVQASAVQCDGGRAFVRVPTGEIVIDMNPSDPGQIIGRFDLPAGKAVVEGNRLLLNRSDIAEIRLYSITNLAAPTLQGTCFLPVPGRDAAICGDIAYVADSWGGLQVVDLSDPELLGVTNTVSFSNVLDVAASGDTLFLWNSDEGLHVFDIKDRRHPSEVGKLSVNRLVYQLVPAGDVLYALSDPGYFCLDVIDREFPEVIAERPEVLSPAANMDGSLWAAAAGSIVQISVFPCFGSSRLVGDQLHLKWHGASGRLEVRSLDQLPWIAVPTSGTNQATLKANGVGRLFRLNTAGNSFGN